jgi:hypothetical protein
MSNEKEDFFDFAKNGGLLEVFAVVSDFVTVVPIASAIINSAKYGIYLREKIFLEKFVKLLERLRSGFKDEADSKRFQDFIQSNKSNDRFNTNIVILIDRMDRIEKSDIIANILLEMSRGSLTYKEGMRLMSMVDRVYFEDLEYLKKFKDGVQRENSLIAQNLMIAGFLSDGGLDGGDWDDPLSSGTIYVMNIYGEKMKDLILK